MSDWHRTSWASIRANITKGPNWSNSAASLPNLGAFAGWVERLVSRRRPDCAVSIVSSPLLLRSGADRYHPRVCSTFQQLASHRPISLPNVFSRVRVQQSIPDRRTAAGLEATSCAGAVLGRRILRGKERIAWPSLEAWRGATIQRKR